MKRMIYITLISVTVILSFGLRGCEGYLNFIYSLMNYHATGYFGILGDSEPEYYSIAVGNDGSMYIRNGKPPAPWIEAQSGTSNTLTFVKIYNNPDSLIAYAVGDAGTVLFSSDKGYNWMDRSIPSLPNNLYGLDFIDYGTGGVNVVVCGDGGIVYKSTNSGSNFNWQQVNTITTQKLNTIGAITSDLYLAAGENGAIIKTNDGGQSWQNVGIADTSADFNRLFLGVTVSSWDAGWLAGNNGKIYATTDYGYTWLPRASGTIKDLFDITFKNPTEGVVAGRNGTVKFTSDAGLTWQEDSYLSSLTTKDILSISEVDSNTATAITVNNYIGDSQGADTTFILAISSEPFVGVDDEENNIPSEFSLGQNYPNPFNPTTTIRWQQPETGIVILKIYDVLGSEVTTLVDAELSAGTHETVFNASKISSGVYYYQIIAGDFIEAKKMILIK